VDKTGKQQERSDAVQYDQKGYATTGVAIALPFHEERIDADDIDLFSNIDLFSEAGRGFYRHQEPPDQRSFTTKEISRFSPEDQYQVALRRAKGPDLGRG
jgi:hypothetical protein